MLLAVALVALSMAWFLRSEGLDRADKWSSVVFGSVSALAVAAGALTWVWRLGDAPATGSREAALSRLVAAQRRQWAAEQAARRVRDPWPLNVRWVSSARAQAVMASWASVRRSPGAGAVDVDGDYDRIAAVLSRGDVPRRLVILGEPGAGKSMLAIHLTLQLLDRHSEGAPVPVLLTAAGWNPVQSLDDWIADQLIARDHRLARVVYGADGGRRSLARDLVAGGSILPVLDGLDELDEGIQRAALIGISAAAAAGREFVATSRTQPYESAVRVCGPVPAAVVVELQPIPGPEAAQYLADGAAMNDQRWAPVVAHLAGAVATPLAQALSTPLMIWLTRMVYQDPRRDPAELLTADWADSRQGIEEHLLDHLIPAAYASASKRYPARPAAEVDRIRRWLRLLANHMRRHRTYDFAWWQLSEVSPAPVVQLLSVGFAILAALATTVYTPLLGALASSDRVADDPRLQSLVLGVWIGVLAAFARLLFTDRHHPRRLTVRGVRTVFLFVASPAFLIAALAGEPAYGVSLALSAGIVAALGSGSVAEPSAVSPSALLRLDRVTALVSGAAVGAAVAFQFWVSGGTIGLALSTAVVTAIAAVLLSATGQLYLAQLTVSTVHRTPFRLIRSLEEANDRGILRRAGGVHQFRHGLLRDRIAQQAQHDRDGAA